MLEIIHFAKCHYTLCCGALGKFEMLSNLLLQNVTYKWKKIFILQALAAFKQKENH